MSAAPASIPARRVGGLALVLLLAGSSCTPRREACPASPRGGRLAVEAVRYLADSALAGRRAGTAGERCAAEYVAAHFRRLGLEPAGEGGTFFQRVLVPDPFDPYARGDTGRSVIARLPGRDPVLRADVLVVGAHLDHLGVGGRGSLAPEAKRTVHPGADDNASGIAAMLLVAERLARAPPARSVIFVAFSGEELGLLGAYRYVTRPPVPLERTTAMLNLDMVGRLERDPLVVNGAGTAAQWPALVAAANRAGLPLELRPEGIGPSDHAWFYRSGVPVLHFYTGTHDDYHRPTDRWQRIDFDGLERIAVLVEGVARAVADRPDRLELVRNARRKDLAAPRTDAVSPPAPPR
jgi:hypothetical protein